MSQSTNAEEVSCVDCGRPLERVQRGLTMGGPSRRGPLCRLARRRRQTLDSVSRAAARAEQGHGP